MADEKMPVKPGIHQLTMTLKSGIKQRYTLSLPAGFDVRNPVPFVLALHYGGQVTPWYGGGYLNKLPAPALEDLGALIVAPDCLKKGWTNPESEGALLELFDYIKAHYSIDEKRTLITGFSMGGIGTWYMISRHPEIFTAAIPVSSSIHPLVLGALREIPIYAIHSTGDEIFPVELVKEMANKVTESGIQLHLEVIDRISHYHTERFVPSLKNTVPWIKEKWQKTGKIDNS
jgi:predicted peptidase